MQLTEILESAILLVEEAERNELKGYKDNLKSAQNFNQISIKDSVAAIAKITEIFSAAYRNNRDNSEIIEIKKNLINFLQSEDGLKICLAERMDNPSTARNLDPKGITLTTEQTKSLGNNSLLFRLFAAVPNDYSIDIINAVISGAGDLSLRPDLILVMINQRTISSDPNMSETFDLLVSKNLPKPSNRQLDKLMTDNRLRSGNNASKLALSFLHEQGDDSLISDILEYKYRGNDRETGRAVSREQNELANPRPKNSYEFVKHTKYLIKNNSDEALKQFLKKHATSDFLNDCDKEHASILEIATSNKLIKTFDILVNAGFDPLKRKEGQINPIALACRTQGEVPIESYLDSIKRKFGDKKVKEILAADGGAVIHAIDGRGYVDVVTLLEKEGADLITNLNHILEVAATNNRAGVFDKLLGKASDQEICAITMLLPENVSYVIDCALLSHLEDKESDFAKNLKERIRNKESSLKEDNLFGICEFNGGLTLKYFVEYMKNERNYKIEDHVNDRDELNKTPLYYAISHNAYNGLVKNLLDYGANPNSIAPNLDAATLAVTNKESGTLQLLLESKKLSTDSIESAFLAMKNAVDNTLIASAFLHGLSNEDLDKLNPQTQLDLLNISLTKPELEHCLAKFSNVIKEMPASDLLMKIIEESAPQKLEKLFAHVPIKSLITEETRKINTPNHVFEFANEETALIPSGQIKNSLGRKLSDSIDKKYLRTALEIFENDQNNELKKSTLVVLLDNGFEAKEFDKRLKAVGLKPQECMDYCAVM